MAEVFLARRRSGGVEKLLVIKRIRAERATDARFMELFVREARLSMSLAHQNIVPVFDFGRIGDQLFLAMERVEGKDLGSTLARPDVAPITPVAAAFVAAECCRALAYAHERHRAVHRDVTPRNVLFSWSGEVKLTDFGIAAVTGDQSSRLIGTPAYMAPEQARGETVDARADLYAVGLVLREAVTGVRPRPGDDQLSFVESARANELAPWPSKVPAALVAIADRATATAPADRYPDARAMLAALDAFIVGERAVHAGDAPDRQLAAWLDRAWEGARDDEAPSEMPETGDVVSMFDDVDGVGSATDRSLAATVDNTPLAPTPAPAPVVAPPRRSRMVFALVPLLAVAGIVVFVVARRSAANHVEERDAGGDVYAQIEMAGDARVDIATDKAGDARVDIATDKVGDARVDVEPPRDARFEIAGDARVDVAPHNARIDIPSDAARRVVRDASTTGPRETTTTTDARATAITRKVRVNARPWATFTVDGGATKYETISTIDLAPGTHKLHFSNPQLGIERDVTIDVPSDRDIDHVEDLRR
jgi:hypothetical protein